jgi:hypothetical protein
MWDGDRGADKPPSLTNHPCCSMAFDLFAAIHRLAVGSSQVCVDAYPSLVSRPVYPPDTESLTPRKTAEHRTRRSS